MIAYAWASGRIDFGRKVPDGALCIATGPAKTLRSTIEVLARHGYGKSEGVLLVPGIPEASSQAAGILALIVFQRRVLDALQGAGHAP